MIVENKEARETVAAAPSLGNGDDSGPNASNRTDEPRQPLSGPALAIHQFETMATAISEFELAWLTKRKVSEDALWKPWPIGATTIDGTRYLTFVAFDGDYPLDIVCWQPRTNDLIAYSGRAVFLGDLDEVMNPATYMAGGYLTIHSHPLEWLRANRQGVIIVNEKLAGAYLRDRPRVFCPDPEVAKKLKRLVRSPKPTVKILTAARGAKEFVEHVD